jgi:hypothetical protein
VDDSVTELASKLVDAKLSGSDSKTVTTNMFDPNHEFDLAELELDHDIAQLAEQNRSRKVSPCIQYASYLFNRRLIISKRPFQSPSCWTQLIKTLKNTRR